MLILLSLIAGIVVIMTASYHLQKFGKDKYHYRIFSLGGMGVSILGAVALIFAWIYYHQGLMLNMLVAIILGVTPYILMFIRDSRKMTITLAVAALLLRFTISALLILFILWYFLIRGSSDDRLKAV